jgi:hypothetical protein
MQQMAKPKQYKLDLFNTVLPNLSRKNEKFYKSLSEEEAKDIEPYILMRWMSGTNDARQVYFLNELVNPFVFNLNKKHKELLVDLITLCASGREQRYKFNKTISKKTSSTPKTIEVIKEIFSYNTIDALEVLPLISNDDILSFAEQLGRQAPEITVIKKELKSRQT